MSKELESAFDEAMESIYIRAKQETGYSAQRFFEMLQTYRGLKTAKRLLANSNVSDGYVALWERGRLDLTVEALVLDKRWRPLFSPEELAIAQKRLADYGYQVQLEDEISGQADDSRTYLLIWNPKRWKWDRDDFLNKLEDVRNGKEVIDRWSCGNTKKIQVGDRVYLMRLGEEPKGIFGAGTVVRAPYKNPHWDSGRQQYEAVATYIDFVYEGLLDPETDTILARDLLRSDPELSTMHWDSQMSGISIKREVATRLDAEWKSLIAQSVDILPEEIGEPEKYVEGARRRIVVNAYERNLAARKKCIRHYGPVCTVCGFDFEKVYGPVAAGIIHVHHIVPLSDIDDEYEVDPINDLRPVCPNCHAVIHSRPVPYSLEEVMRMLAESKGDSV